MEKFSLLIKKHFWDRTLGANKYIDLHPLESDAFTLSESTGRTVTLTVNWDFATDLIVSGLNTALLENFLGTLDGSDSAAAVFITYSPLPEGTAVRILSFAYALDKPWNFVSNPVQVRIEP